MASHGILRTQQKPKTEVEVQKELRKIQQYKDLDSQVRVFINAKDYSQDAFDLSSKLLKENPEYYTIWNYRRRILQHFFADDETAIAPRLQEDLEFLFPLLRTFPKCYWIWNHRLWLLTQTSARLSTEQAERAWLEELALAGKMHSRDSRNFHAWDYRRRIISEIRKIRNTKVVNAEQNEAGNEPTVWSPSSRRGAGVDELGSLSMCEEELTYTTKMVRGNLSNFSAWHQRSLFIPQVLHSRDASAEDRRKMFDSELKLSKEAVFLDPWDQSLWFYYNFLMSVLLAPSDASSYSSSSILTKGNRYQWVQFTNEDREKYLATELHEVRELLDDPNVTDCKWVYQSLLSLAEAYMQVEGGTQLEAIKTKNLTDWLDKLNELDPMRHGRWHDWAKRLGL